MTTIPAPDNNELRNEIKHALNRASAENPSGTPDHILADYLMFCLAAFDMTTRARANWHGESAEFHPVPTSKTPDSTTDESEQS